MDYRQTSDTIKDIIMSATPANSDTARFAELDAVEKNREAIVSHMKHGYNQGTEHILTNKEFEYASKEYKNMVYTTEGEVSGVHDKIKVVEKQIKIASDELTKAETTESVLKVIAVAVCMSTLIYFMGSGNSIVHFFALLVLTGGFLYALSLNDRLPMRSNRKPEFPHNNNKWWTSTTPEQ